MNEPLNDDQAEKISIYSAYVFEIRDYKLVFYDKPCHHPDASHNSQGWGGQWV